LKKCPKKIKMIISLKAKCQIYLKPCCKFEFVCFLEIYQRKFIHLVHGGTPEDPFSPRRPKISLTMPILGSVWASMKAKRNNFEIFWKVISKCPNQVEKMPSL